MNTTQQLAAVAAFVLLPGYLFYCYRDTQDQSKKDDTAFVAKSHDYYAAFCKSWPEQECCQRNSDECSPAGKRLANK